MPFQLTFDAAIYQKGIAQSVANALAKPVAVAQVRDYEVQFSKDVAAFMGLGYTAIAFAGAIKISRKTLELWIKTYPEFAEGVELGTAAAIKFWEREQQKAMQEGRSATVATFALKNLAPIEWREKIEVNSTVSVTISQAELTDAIDRKFSKLIEHDPLVERDPSKTKH